MSVHSDGLGSSWNETLDIDQPHGLDYREWNDVRVGTRKRMAQEHSSFADATVGGIHKPGGVAVLAMEEGTATIVGDGTLRARGLAWDLSGKLFCNTSNAGVSTTGDWTVLLLHPDKQWKGGDITWQGVHSFAQDVSVAGALYVDSSVDVSQITVDGSADISGALDCSVLNVDSSSEFAGVAAFASDISVDGTSALQDTVFTGDCTVTFDPIAGETGPIFKIFGDWSGRSGNTTYTARTDGIVSAFTGGGNLNINTPTGTTRVQSAAANGNNAVTCPVKAGDTWDVSGVGVGGSTVYWLPFGDNT